MKCSSNPGPLTAGFPGVVVSHYRSSSQARSRFLERTVAGSGDAMTTTRSSSSIQRLTMSSNAGSSSSILKLLQQYTRAQETRTGINIELSKAFDEEDISDPALQKVVEISSIGLLEVKGEGLDIIAKLEALAGQAGEAKEAAKTCRAIEALEKERLTESTRGQQLKRIQKLSRTDQDEEQQDEIRQALATSDTK